jgi:cytosine/adenosine deaminase-related metal-dependent hydrolase
MREHKLGELEVGAPADLILVDLNSLPFTPLNNLHRQLVYCELGQSVSLTMVAGSIVVSEKQMSTVNEVDILEETREVFERQRKNLLQSFTKMDEIIPYYKKMYEMAGAYQLNMQRRLN